MAMAMAAISLPRISTPSSYCTHLHNPHHVASARLISFPPFRLLAPRLLGHTPQQLLRPELHKRSSHRCGIRSGQSVSVTASLVQSSYEVLSPIVRAISRYAVAVALIAKAMSKNLTENVFSVVRPLEQEEAKALAGLRASLGHAAVPLCFAAISQSPRVSTPLTVVAAGMAKWLELYSGVLMIRVLLSWFPNIPWDRQPLQAIRDMCDPYLNLFRNLIPPIFNALDVSPMLAFFVLGLLASILNTTVHG